MKIKQDKARQDRPRRDKIRQGQARHEIGKREAKINFQGQKTNIKIKMKPGPRQQQDNTRQHKAICYSSVH